MMSTHTSVSSNGLRSPQLHRFWLKITAIVVGSFGPVFFLGTMPEWSGAAAWTMDILSWPLDGNHDFSAPTTRFLSALTGGFLLGWGVMIWCLSVWVYDKAPEFVRRSVLIGILAWFFLDSSGSIASGNASNALFNVAVLLIGVGPMWLPARAVRGE